MEEDLLWMLIYAKKAKKKKEMRAKKKAEYEANKKKRLAAK